MRINLNDPDIMDSKEAVTKWGIDDSTLRKRKDDFPKGSIRKIGTSWAVTRYGMEVVFGKLKEANGVITIVNLESFDEDVYDRIHKLSQESTSDKFKFDGETYIYFKSENETLVEQYFGISNIESYRSEDIIEFLEYFNPDAYIRFKGGLEISKRECIDKVKVNISKYEDRIWNAADIWEEVELIIKEQMFTVYMDYMSEGMKIVHDGNFEW